MDPVLDETSLTPCDNWLPAVRVKTLALLIKSLDQLGFPRVLRSVRDAAHRDIGDGRGLNSWCGDRQVDVDARRLLLSRLSKHPFIDGNEGLFNQAQRDFAVEGRFRGLDALGLTVAALTGSVAIGLLHHTAEGGMLQLGLTFLQEDDLFRADEVLVPYLAKPEDVNALREPLVTRLDLSVASGEALLRRTAEMFPRLRFGARAQEQISALSGREAVFRQLLWHLRVLDQAAAEWSGGPFEPRGICWSTESEATLSHGRFGPMRDFPVPDGFSTERWKLHTKPTGGGGTRLYYRFDQIDGEALVGIGYFGPHLSTVNHP